MPAATTAPTSSDLCQDKWQITPTLSLTAGVRYDWDGGLTEKYGRIFNFDPKPLQLQRGSDAIENPA